MVKVFETAPSGFYGILAMIIPYVVAGSILYMDSVFEGYTNPVVFFFVIIVSGLLVNGVTGIRNIIKLLGLDTSVITSLVLFLSGTGLTILLFFGLYQPMSILLNQLGLRGLASSLFPLYNPFATTIGGQLALSSLTGFNAIFYVILFFGAVVIGETALRVGSYKAGFNALSEYTNLSYGAIAVIVLSIINILWAVLHFVSQGNALLTFIPFAFIMGVIWFFGYYAFGESLVTPEKGVQFIYYGSLFEIASHFTWDCLVGFMTLNILPPQGISIIIGMLFLVIAILLHFYEKM